jgi:hypothetical protein
MLPLAPLVGDGALVTEALSWLAPHALTSNTLTRTNAAAFGMTATPDR